MLIYVLCLCHADLMMGSCLNRGRNWIESTIFFELVLSRQDLQGSTEVPIFKQYPNESRKVDRLKDAPRNRISALRVGRESLLTKPFAFACVKRRGTIVLANL